MNCLILKTSSNVLISGWIWMDLGKKCRTRCVDICPGEGLKTESLFIKQSVKRRLEGSPLQNKVLFLFSLRQCLQEQQRLQPHSTGAGGQQLSPPCSGSPRSGRDGADAACVAHISGCYREFVAVRNEMFWVSDRYLNIRFLCPLSQALHVRVFALPRLLQAASAILRLPQARRWAGQEAYPRTA